MRSIAVATLVSAFCLGCTPSDVHIFAAKVPQGRRAVAIAVSQNNEKRIIVASASGAIRDIAAQIGHGDTFHNDRHPDLKADYVAPWPMGRRLSGRAQLSMHAYGATA